MLNSKGNKAPGALEGNIPKLKKVFSRLLPDEEGRVPFNEIVKFCKLTKIFPVSSRQDLVSNAELKKLAGRTGSSVKLSFFQFEDVLRLIAASFFTDQSLSDRMRQLIRHIKNPCKAVYGVTLLSGEPRVSKTLHSSLPRPKSVNQMAYERGNSMKIDVDISTALEALKSPKSNIRRSPSGSFGRTSPSDFFSIFKSPGSNRPKFVEDDYSTLRFLSQPATSRHNQGSFKLDTKSVKLPSSQIEVSEFIETERNITQKKRFSVLSRKTTRPPLVPPLSILSLSSKENILATKAPPTQKSSREDSLKQIKSKFESFKSKHLLLTKKALTSRSVIVRRFIDNVPGRFFRQDFVTRLIFNAWHGLVFD